jgi:hypothetical protein
MITHLNSGLQFCVHLEASLTSHLGSVLTSYMSLRNEFKVSRLFLNFAILLNLLPFNAGHAFLFFES